MRQNSKTILSGFLTGGLLFTTLYFGMNFSGQNIYASIGLIENAGENNLINNSLIAEQTQEEIKDFNRLLTGKVSHPIYIPLKNSFRYINNKTGDIEEYSIDSKKINTLSKKTQGVRLAQWSINGDKVLLFSPYGARFLNLNDNSSKSYDQSIIRPSLNDIGDKIVFIESKNNGHYSIKLGDVELKNTREVLETRNLSWSISWINDKNLILTNIKDPIAQQVFVLNIDSGELRSVTDQEIIESVFIPNKKEIFLRLTNDDGDTITDTINISDNQRSHMALLDGDSKCAKTIGEETYCINSTEYKNKTEIKLLKRDNKNIIRDLKNYEIEQFIDPDDLFISYDAKRIYIYDLKYNQILDFKI